MHTPTPWVIGAYPEQAGYYVRGEGDTIQVCNIPYYSAQGLANAVIIARAINSHDVLLEACEAAFERLTDNDMIGLGSYPLADQILAALKLAKGE